MSSRILISLLAAFDAYRVAAGLSETQASSRVFQHSYRARELRDGADIAASRVESALLALHDQWPEGEPRPQALVDLMLAVGLGFVRARSLSGAARVEGVGGEARIEFAAGHETAAVADLAAIEGALARTREAMEARARDGLAA